jgi:hypothetical protein
MNQALVARNIIDGVGFTKFMRYLAPYVVDFLDSAIATLAAVVVILVFYPIYLLAAAAKLALRLLWGGS